MPEFKVSLFNSDKARVQRPNLPLSKMTVQDGNDFTYRVGDDHLLFIDDYMHIFMEQYFIARKIVHGFCIFLHCRDVLYRQFKVDRFNSDLLPVHMMDISIFCDIVNGLMTEIIMGISIAGITLMYMVFFSPADAAPLKQ